MKFETDAWPIIKARDFKTFVGPRVVRVIVIHDMEAKEKGDTAESIGYYFKNPDKPSSAHIGVDSNTVVQYVADNNIAYAAPGANSDGIHIELAGYGIQTREEWLDVYGKSMLERAADACAQYCIKYSIPLVHLTNDQLARGLSGIVGHSQVSDVYKKSDHSDPGPGFPWDYFIARANCYYTRYGVLVDA